MRLWLESESCNNIVGFVTVVTVKVIDFEHKDNKHQSITFKNWLNKYSSRHKNLAKCLCFVNYPSCSFTIVRLSNVSEQKYKFEYSPNFNQNTNSYYRTIYLYRARYHILSLHSKALIFVRYYQCWCFKMWFLFIFLNNIFLMTYHDLANNYFSCWW